MGFGNAIWLGLFMELGGGGGGTKFWKGFQNFLPD